MSNIYRISATGGKGGRRGSRIDQVVYTHVIFSSLPLRIARTATLSRRQVQKSRAALPPHTLPHARNLQSDDRYSPGP